MNPMLATRSPRRPRLVRVASTLAAVALTSTTALGLGSA
jgi:hypothetical protein